MWRWFWSLRGCNIRLETAQHHLFVRFLGSPFLVFQLENLFLSLRTLDKRHSFQIILLERGCWYPRKIINASHTAKCSSMATLPFVNFFLMILLYKRLIAIPMQILSSHFVVFLILKLQDLFVLRLFLRLAVGSNVRNRAIVNHIGCHDR